MKKPAPDRSIWIVTTVLIGALIIGTLGAYFLYEKTAEVQSFPPLTKHADLPRHPMESFAASQLTKLPADLSTPPVSSCPKLSATWVKDENQKPGIGGMNPKAWHDLDLSAAMGSALWLDKTSVGCGDSVNIHAALYESNDNPELKGPRTFAAWRIGYYNGDGAREVWRSTPFNLKKRMASTSRDATRFTEAKWPVTTSFTVGDDWTPGFYLIVSLSPKGQIENAAPLIVRSPIGSSQLLMMQSTFTWEMYNSFGGRSGYQGPGKDGQPDSDQRSRVVTFDRPTLGSGAYSIQRDAIPFIQFTESQGINIDQVSDLDLNNWPSIINHYNGIVIGGHAEYFTHRLFETFVAARNIGKNIAVFGGNTAYWQTRLTPSPLGPDRRLVMYRDATEDPDTSLDQVTIEFANKRLNTPPNLITGEETDGVHVYGTLSPVSIPNWISVNHTIPIAGVSSDSEVESTISNLAEPPHVHVMYSGDMKWRDPSRDEDIHRPPMAQVDWIAFPSGGAEFDAGMTTWSCQLSASCVDTPFAPQSQALIRSITLQILNLWQQPQEGRSLVSGAK